MSLFKHKAESGESEPVVRKRTVVTFTLPDDVIEWLEEKVDSHVFYNKSHGVESALRELMDREKKEKTK